jgi:hypothetical protein
MILIAAISSPAMRLWPIFGAVEQAAERASVILNAYEKTAPFIERPVLVIQVLLVFIIGCLASLRL